MMHSDRPPGTPIDATVSQTFPDDDAITSRQASATSTTTGPIRHSQMVFATDIAQGLITEVRKLQQTIQEKDRIIKDLEIFTADNVKDKEQMQIQLQQKRVIEEKLKEDNWNLEVTNQDLQTELSELNLSITKLNTEHSKAMKQLRTSLEQIEIYKAQQEKATSTMDVLKARHDHEQQILRRNTGNLQRDVVQLKKRLDELNVELKICKSKLAIRSTIDNSNNSNKRNDKDNDNNAAQTDNYSSGTGGDNLVELNSSQHDNNPSSSISANSQQRALEVETLKQSLGHAQRMISNLRNNLQKEKVEKVELRKVLADTQDSMERMQKGATSNANSGGHGSLKKSSVASRTKVTRKRGGISRKRSTIIMETPAVYMGNDQLGSLALDTTFEVKNHAGNNGQLKTDNNSNNSNTESDDDDISIDDSSSVGLGAGSVYDDDDDDDDDCHQLELSPIEQGQSLDVELQLGGFTSSFQPLSLDQKQPEARQYFDKGVNTCDDLAVLSTTGQQITSDMGHLTVSTRTSTDVSNEKDSISTDSLSQRTSAPEIHLNQQTQSMSSYQQNTLNSKDSPIPSFDTSSQRPQQITGPLPESRSSGTLSTCHGGTNTPLPSSPSLSQQQQQHSPHSTEETISNTTTTKNQLDAKLHQESNTSSRALISNETSMIQKTVKPISAVEHDGKHIDHDLKTVYHPASQDTNEAKNGLETSGSSDLIDCLSEPFDVNGTLDAVDFGLERGTNMDTMVDAGNMIGNVNGGTSTTNITKMISMDEADALIKAGIADALAKERLEAATRRSEMDSNFVTRLEAEAMAKAHTEQALKKERDRTSILVTKAQAKKSVEQVVLDHCQQQSQELKSKLPPTPATSSLMAKANLVTSRQDSTPPTTNITGTISRRPSHVSLAPSPKPSTSTSSSTTTTSSSSRLGIFSGFRKLQPSISTPAKSPRLRPSVSTSSLRRTATATSNSSQQQQQQQHYQSHHNQQQSQRYGDVNHYLHPPSHADASSYGTVRITESSTYTRKPSISSLRQQPQQSTKQSSIQSLSSSLGKTGDIGGNMAPSAFSMGDLSRQTNSAELISAITQVMIGEWMWKHTRKHVGSGISVNKHKRFFWVHPYTRTLYWSTNEPGIDSDEAKSKSAFIEGVSSIPSNDDGDASPLSLLIKTGKRDLKLTAPTADRHELWRMSLSYLLVPPGEEPQMGDVIQVDPYHDSGTETIQSTTSAIGGDDGMTMVATNSQTEHDDDYNKAGLVTSTSDDDDSDDSLGAMINVRQRCDDHDVAALSHH